VRSELRRGVLRASGGHTISTCFSSARNCRNNLGGLTKRNVVLAEEPASPVCRYLTPANLSRLGSRSAGGTKQSEEHENQHYSPCRKRDDQDC
jgi:hypothetical protein